MIHDVLGLIVLVVVNVVAEAVHVEVGAITRLIVLSVVFVGLAVFLSTLIARLPLERLPVGSPLGFALALGVGMAALAASIGLAPIVGAFLGGMLLSEVREKYRLEEPIFAIESFLAPIFFAMVGVRLELSALASPVVLVAGTVVTVIAILGKVLGGFLGALTQGVRSALTVGVGMAPRGEVGLIVAALGLKAGAVNEEEYAIVLFMVVFTTLFAPFALKPLIAWTERERAAKE